MAAQQFKDYAKKVSTGAPAQTKPKPVVVEKKTVTVTTSTNQISPQGGKKSDSPNRKGKKKNAVKSEVAVPVPPITASTETEAKSADPNKSKKSNVSVISHNRHTGDIEGSEFGVDYPEGGTAARKSDDITKFIDEDMCEMMVCWRCEQKKKPILAWEPSACTHIMAAMMCLLCLTPLVYIPYWCNCQSTPVKRCSNCGAYLTEPVRFQFDT